MFGHRLLTPLIFVATAGVLAPQDARAQFTGDAVRKVEADPIAEAQALVGRTFWTSPHRTEQWAVDFRQDPRDYKTFRVTEDIQFTVVDVVNALPSSRAFSGFVYLKVVFSDAAHTVGYLSLQQFQMKSQLPDNPEAPLFEFNISETKAPRLVAEERAKASKAKIDAELQAIEDNAKRTVEARYAHPPRIGMTAAQVRASSWGQPQDINTTTTRGRVMDQYVYEWGYVYLVNGIVTAIQD